MLDTLQHKAVLKVGEDMALSSCWLQITEKGTEAAAATSAVQFYLGPMFSITFDRPFFLFIYDALNKVAMTSLTAMTPPPR